MASLGVSDDDLLGANCDKTAAADEKLAGKKSKKGGQMAEDVDTTGGKLTLVIDIDEDAEQPDVHMSWWSIVIRVVGVFILLYFFICSLDVLGSAFKLLGGKTAGQVFSHNGIVSNPVAGLMIGVLVTVLLQSSSTSSSLVVAMVANSFITVEQAVPIIMGANIGTSVTNTIVALSHIRDCNMYERAFAAATVHDMFNILTMTVLLPLEWTTKLLTRLSGLIVDSLNLTEGNENAEVEFLSRFTDPLTDMIVVLNKTYISEISKGNPVGKNEQVLKRFCDESAMVNETMEVKRERCESLFSQFDLSDKAAGAILLCLSLAAMFCCLILMVKVLKSIFHGHISKVINKTVNTGFPGRFNFLTGYVAILIGAVLTVLVQSSSIFTSTLTPLVGLNIITLERAFPLTLGSNIGTTVTSMLAAFASDSHFDLALTVSLCHLLFNVIGILIWYPVPVMRRVPLNCAKQLGRTTSKYRWFAFAYIIVVFLVIPAIIFALSLAGTMYVIVFCSAVMLVAFLCSGLKVLQTYFPNCLPEKLRTFRFLPRWLRSLEPFHNSCAALFWKLKGGAPKARQRLNTESSMHLAPAEEDEDAEANESSSPQGYKKYLKVLKIESNGKSKSNKSTYETDHAVYKKSDIELVVELNPDEKIYKGKEATETTGNGNDSGISSNSSACSKQGLDDEDEKGNHKGGTQNITSV